MQLVAHVEASGVLYNRCVGNKGLRVAPQVGLEPTTLRLTAEWPFVVSRCKHNHLHARNADYRVNWGDSGGTPNAGALWPSGGLHCRISEELGSAGLLSGLQVCRGVRVISRGAPP